MDSNIDLDLLQKDAYMYLQNAYSLLRQSEHYNRRLNMEKESAFQDHTESVSNIKTGIICKLNRYYLNIINGGSEMDATLMKQAVLVNMAYITLCSNQPDKTLTAVAELRMMPDLDISVITVASFYEAEALCLMDRPEKAEEVLKVALEMAGEKVYQFLNS